MDIFGLGAYQGNANSGASRSIFSSRARGAAVTGQQSAVFRALPRRAGSVDPTGLAENGHDRRYAERRALTKATKTDGQDLVWNDPDNAVNLKNLIQSLKNQSALADEFKNYSVVFGLGDTYVGSGTDQSAIFRALIGQLEASIKLGTRTTGTVVTPLDDLSGVMKATKQDLIWDEDNNGLANLISSLKKSK